MKISAVIRNAQSHHAIAVSTAGVTQAINVPAKTDGRGSAVNGGEFLMLALATCYCNDLYREAVKLGISIDSVEVEAEADFPGAGLADTYQRPEPQPSVTHYISSLGKLAATERPVRNTTGQRVFDGSCNDSVSTAVMNIYLGLLRSHAEARGPYREIPRALQYLNRLRCRPDVRVAYATGGWRTSAEYKLVSAGFPLEDIPLASADDYQERTQIMLHALGQLEGPFRTLLQSGGGRRRTLVYPVADARGHRLRGRHRQYDQSASRWPNS
jgi:hypothetical protein